jgi:hypothetical protein
VRKRVQRYGWQGWQHEIEKRLTAARKVVHYPSHDHSGEPVIGSMPTPPDGDLADAVDHFVSKALVKIGDHKNVAISKIRFKEKYGKTHVIAHVHPFS